MKPSRCIASIRDTKTLHKPSFRLISKRKNRGKLSFVKFEAQPAGFIAYKMFERGFLREIFVYAPGERNQITPVNRYTTGGFRWVLDFGLILVEYGFDMIYIPLMFLPGGAGAGGRCGEGVEGRLTQ